jgi:hypothetical protein
LQKKESFDAYIGRLSKWGYPFKIGIDGSRQDVIRKYRQWILANPELMAKLTLELKGKTLGYFGVDQTLVTVMY